MQNSIKALIKQILFAEKYIALFSFVLSGGFSRGYVLNGVENRLLSLTDFIIRITNFTYGDGLVLSTQKTLIATHFNLLEGLGIFS